MIKAIEFHGEAGGRNVDELVNEFLVELTPEDEIIEIKYNTALVPLKTDNAIKYIVVGSVLIVYDENETDD